MRIKLHQSLERKLEIALNSYLVYAIKSIIVLAYTDGSHSSCDS